MLGKSLDELGVSERPIPRHVAARERVFPFERLGVDPALGREMRSTGEVIGLDDSPARAYGKALRGIGIALRAPEGGASAGPRGVLLSVDDSRRSPPRSTWRGASARSASMCTRSARSAPRSPPRASPSTTVAARARRRLEDIRAGRIAFAVVTAKGDSRDRRTRALRAATLSARIPCFTTIRLARLGCSALEEAPTARVRPLQDWYAADD